MTKRKPRFWILDGKEVVGTDDVLKWGKMFEEESRIVRQEDIKPLERDGLFSPVECFDCRVSTVFLGLDHSYGSGGPDIFETMVFGGPLDLEERRYSTWDEAELGHLQMVWRVQSVWAMARGVRSKVGSYWWDIKWRVRSLRKRAA
jgi:hypothetical protein